MAESNVNQYNPFESTLTDALVRFMFGGRKRPKREVLSRPVGGGRLGERASRRLLCYWVRAETGCSAVTCTAGFGSWTSVFDMAFGALETAFLAFGFGATFFAAFTCTCRTFRDAGALAFFRFAAGLLFGLAASAFFALSSRHRLR
jgi:hypothetical protein